MNHATHLEVVVNLLIIDVRVIHELLVEIFSCFPLHVNDLCHKIINSFTLTIAYVVDND